MAVKIFIHCISAAVWAGFLARNIKFHNMTGPSKHQGTLRVESYLSAFHECVMLAYQDTFRIGSTYAKYLNTVANAGTLTRLNGRVAGFSQLQLMCSLLLLGGSFQARSAVFPFSFALHGKKNYILRRLSFMASWLQYEQHLQN